MNEQWYMNPMALQFVALQNLQNPFSSGVMLPPLLPYGPTLPPGLPPIPNNAVEHNSDSDAEVDEDDEQLRTLFCANLDERVTEELLYEVFLQAGPLDSVRIAKDNRGRQRSFGFVIFTHRCSIPYAMELMQGLTLYKKTLTIKYQNSSQIPFSPQQAPAKSDTNIRHSENSDNFALRGSFSRASHSSSSSLSVPSWTLGTAARSNGRDDIPKRSFAHSRPHHHSSPYNYTESSRNNRHERERHQQPHHSRHHDQRHSGHSSDRRSEQRRHNQRR